MKTVIENNTHEFIVPPGVRISFKADKDNIEIDAEGDFDSLFFACGIILEDMLADIIVNEPEHFESALSTVRNNLNTLLSTARKYNNEV